MNTKEAELLWKALIARKIAVTDQFDGERAVDLAIPESKILIEIEEGRQNKNIDETIEDIKSVYQEYLEGYFILTIPIKNIHENLNEIVDLIVDLVEEKNKKDQNEEILRDEQFDTELDEVDY